MSLVKNSMRSIGDIQLGSGQHIGWEGDYPLQVEDM